MTSLFRFEKLAYFEQAVANRELTFVSPFHWPESMRDSSSGLVIVNGAFTEESTKSREEL